MEHAGNRDDGYSQMTHTPRFLIEKPVPYSRNMAHPLLPSGFFSVVLE
jgi:hypothetical protein